MEYTEFKAKTLEEAITKASLAFSVVSARLDYTVVQAATSGFLGIGAKPCIIKARPKPEEPEQVEKPKAVPKPVAKPAPKPVPKPAPVKAEKTPEKPVQVKPASPKKEEPVRETPAKQANEASPKEEAASPKASENHFVSMDEIELRAARAAAKAKENGEEPQEETKNYRREERPARGRRDFDRRDNRKGGYERRERGGRGGRGYNDRYGKYDRPGIGTFVEEKPHEPSAPKPDRVVKERSEEEIARIKAAAEKFLKDVFDSMKCDVNMNIEYDPNSGCLNIDFSGEDMGILIGKRGQTLDSLQYLTSLVVNKEAGDYVRLKLDTEDYRARRADTLENLARNVAYKVKQSGRAIALEPMNPYERRIIHSALQHNRFVETYSEGEEPYRHVVVAPRKA